MSTIKVWLISSAPLTLLYRDQDYELVVAFTVHPNMLLSSLEEKYYWEYAVRKNRTAVDDVLKSIYLQYHAIYPTSFNIDLTF